MASPVHALAGAVERIAGWRRPRRYGAPLVLLAAGLLSWVGADRTPGRPVVDSHLLVGDWAAEVQHGRGTDRLVIWMREDRRGNPLPFTRWRRVYRGAYDGTIVSVSPWERPGSVYSIGLSVTVLSGRRQEVLFLAEVGPGCFVPVSRILGAPGIEEHDLDGDREPELITCADAGPPSPTTRAAVWKWSPARRRYVKVRESSYADRLKPLHLKGFR